MGSAIKPRRLTSTTEFVELMGDMVNGVIDGSVTPEKAKVVISGGNAILRAMELNMQWSELNKLDPKSAMPLLPPEEVKS